MLIALVLRLCGKDNQCTFRKLTERSARYIVNNIVNKFVVLGFFN